MGEQETYKPAGAEPARGEGGMNHVNIFEATEAERLVRLHTLWQLSSHADKLAERIIADSVKPDESEKPSLIRRQIDRLLNDPSNRDLSIPEDDADGLKLQAVIDALQGDDERRIRAALVVLRDLHVITLRHGDVDSKLWIDLSRKLLVDYEIIDLDSES